MASGSVRIREAEPGDWPAIWPFFREIVRAGETYAYDRDMGEEEGRRLWMRDGFEVVGTVPEALHHPERGYVGLHVMHRRL